MNRIRRTSRRCIRVEALEARMMLTALTVTSAADSGPGTLRQAILDANVSAGSDTISFNIGGGGVQTILPASPMPTITSPVTIDATTQPGFSGVPLIRLNGGSVGSPAIDLTGGSSVVRGLAIGFFTTAIQVSGQGGVTISGNYIGTYDGLISANNGVGVVIDGVSDVTIGGTGDAARNVISGNAGRGIEALNGLTGLIVRNNFIGVSADGTALLNNAGNGILIQGGSGNVIGGPAASDGNIISGSGASGIAVNTNGGAVGTGLLIQGNVIGSGAVGRQVVDALLGGASSPLVPESLGNNGNGIVISEAEGTRIVQNLITKSQLDGINFASSIAGVDNQISRDLIFNNDGIGIRLTTTVDLPNDAGDVDAGTNNLQNFPVLSAAVASVGHTRVAGAINSSPDTTFHIELFASVAPDATGFGEGQMYIGAVDVTTDAQGNGSFSTIADFDAHGQFITATATDPTGNTSQFSAAIAATAPNFAAVVDGLLTVNGTSGDDTIAVTRDGSTLVVTLNDDGQSFDINTVTGIVVLAGDGDDSVSVGTGIGGGVRVDGGNGKDSLTGGDGNDSLTGGAGDDVFASSGGFDTLEGGAGNDRYVISAHTVQVLVNELDDEGEDTIDLESDPTGGSFDVSGAGEVAVGLVNASGVENVWAGAGNDTFAFFDGGSLAGSIRAGGGTNTLDYSARTSGVAVDLGVKTATGAGSAEDFRSVIGSPAGDSITGSADADTINGGAGDDSISGLAGNDFLTGGLGNDRIFGGDGNDAVFGSDGNDALQGNGGDDRIRGGAGNDTIFGQAGNDNLNGDAGNDRILGGAGNDTITGGAGADFLKGDAGNDTFYSKDRVRDSVYGASGADRARADRAIDLLSSVEQLF